MFEIGVTYHFAKGKIRAETEKFYDKENESSMGGDDNEDAFFKLDPEKEKLKKRLINVKKDSVNNFLKIEDKHNDNLVSHSYYLKKIFEYKNIPSNKKGDLFDCEILEKNLFDKDLTDSERTDKNNQDFTGNKQRFDRIEYLLNLEKEKREKDGTLDPVALKNDIINIFKEEKMHVTNILQDELKKQIAVLNKEIEDFKNKDNFSKQDLDDHNEKVNDIQRKINIIYQRSHRHITNIMEELNVLMSKLDTFKISDY
jgi:hypothetical protein